MMSNISAIQTCIKDHLNPIRPKSASDRSKLIQSYYQPNRPDLHIPYVRVICKPST